ncbi:hypothetical protein TWF102_009620 [Orbilia oligospora]|uniref:Uncharacterized protein n=1 Tax=Orbilia oligospora TaxID=2813651 RepID=A0A7C8N870_ORBOL|nr:hypothetical protein TWF102_009620 [Orbilia oligospora]
MAGDSGETTQQRRLGWTTENRNEITTREAGRHRSRRWLIVYEESNRRSRLVQPQVGAIAYKALFGIRCPKHPLPRVMPSRGMGATTKLIWIWAAA